MSTNPTQTDTTNEMTASPLSSTPTATPKPPRLNFYIGPDSCVYGSRQEAVGAVS